MTKQENMAQSMAQSKSLETIPTEMGTYELPTKEFKIIVLNKVNDL